MQHTAASVYFGTLNKMLFLSFWVFLSPEQALRVPFGSSLWFSICTNTLATQCVLRLAICWVFVGMEGLKSSGNTVHTRLRVEKIYDSLMDAMKCITGKKAWGTEGWLSLYIGSALQFSYSLFWQITTGQRGEGSAEQRWEKALNSGVKNIYIMEIVHFEFQKYIYLWRV